MGSIYTMGVVMRRDVLSVAHGVIDGLRRACAFVTQVSRRARAYAPQHAMPSRPPDSPRPPPPRPPPDDCGDAGGDGHANSASSSLLLCRTIARAERTPWCNAMEWNVS